MSCTALSDAPSRSIKLATLFVTLVTTWVFSGQVLAATSTVCDSGCDYTSIEIAVDNASDGDTLDIQSTITESGIFVHRPLTILSSLPTPQIVQAHALPETASDRVFFISAPGEVVIENLTIRHGVAPGNGFGGGIYTDTELTLVGVQVENNFAGSGGGMVVQSATNSSVVTIRQSTFRANRSSSSGGAVHCDAGAIVDVKDSTFAHNSSFEGGAFRATSSCTLSVENSTISMNRANNGGGGIFNRGNTTVTDSTFSRNSLRAIQSNEGSFVITNSILADSLTTPFGEGGPDCDVFSGATITDGGYNLVENTGGCGSFFTATGTVTGVDPELNVLAKYGGPTMTHYFLQSSPVYNTGSTSGSFDQRGFARGIFGADDKGAVELQVEEIFIPSVFLAQAIHVGVSYNIEFEWFSNRSPNFDVQIQQSGGSYLPFSPFYFHHRTYIGKVDGVPGATAAAMFFPYTGELVYNVIFEDGSEWNHVNGATTERSIALPDNWPQWSARTGGAGSKIWAAEVGVDMPFNDYIEIHGSDPDEAIAWIEYSIMKANLLYLQQVGVKHELGRVILRSNVGSDPYNGINNHIDNLAQIETQWETELPLTFPNSTHDIALVTGVRDGGGLASTGSIGSPGYSSNSPAITVPATTISRGDFSGVWRHEAGHNWGLRHFVSDATNNSTMMGGNYARIWGPSQDTVLSYRDSIVGELDDLGSASAAIPPRASLDAAFIDASQATTLIDVLANDHDANGEALTLVSVDSTSALGLGGTMALAVGEGGIGQDVVRYTAPAVGGPTSAIDRFTYRIRDASGQEATGYVFVRMVEFGDASTYVQNFDGFADGTTVIGDGSYLSTANNEPTYLPLSVTNGVLTLMPEQGGRRTSYTLPLRNLTDGFVAQFTYNISSSGGIPADGFAFNFGDPSPRVAPDLVGSNGGFRRGMTIDFDTYNDNQGYNVSVDNVTVAYVPDALIPDGFDHNAVVSWNPTNGLTLKIDGVTVFDGLDLSAEFTPTADDMLAFAARTGGLDQQVLLDNVVVSPAVVVPLNDDFDDAIDISLGSSTVGTLVNATTDGSVTLTTLYTGDVWYTYTAASTGNLFLNTCSSQLTYGVDTVLSVHSNTGVPGTIDNQLTANDDYESGDDPAVCDVSGSLLDSAVVLSVTAGTTYLIRVSLYNVPEGQFVLNWRFEEPVVDTDGDGVFDNTDNCTLVANSDQRDTNGDGYGNICDPDLNNDGIVNFLDFSAWRPLFNTTCGDVDADLNGDGLCNFGDYAIFPGFFQQPPGPRGVAP